MPSMCGRGTPEGLISQADDRSTAETLLSFATRQRDESQVGCG